MQWRTNILFYLSSSCQPPAGPDGARLLLDELRALETQVAAPPSGKNGTVLFLKGGVLAVVGMTIAAEVGLRGAAADVEDRRTSARPRPHNPELRQAACR